MTQRQTDAAKFALRAVAWSLGLFALLRIPWFAAHVLLPLTQGQGAVAAALGGTTTLPVEVTLACSGADVLALCVGTILAYPVRWNARLAGAAGGATLILVLNILRIGTLARAVTSPAWFDLLHLYLWPALLMLAVAGYVFAWMRVADGGSPAASQTWRAQPSRRFLILAAVFLIIFVVLSPLSFESTGALAAAGFVARAGAVLLSAAGISAHASGNVLWTTRGGFLVTPECVATPLAPVYLAAVCAYSTSWRRLVPGMLAVFPLFIVLGILRLLTVALPGVASPLFFVHAFYQLLLGALLVVIAALWRHGRRTAGAYAAAGVIVGTLFAYLLGPVYTRAVSREAIAALDDPQGAIAFLPAFQIALYLALWVAAFTAAGWRRFVAGFAVLALTQSAGLLALHALFSHAGWTAHVREVRGWAIAGPVLIVAAIVTHARTAR